MLITKLNTSLIKQNKSKIKCMGLVELGFSETNYSQITFCPLVLQLCH